MSSRFVAFTILFASLPCLAQTTLTVAAAADLSKMEPELAGSFGKTAANVRIEWVTGASGSLSQQIEHGAPYDVFLSANAAFVDKLASNGKLRPDSVAIYATGRLGVLWKDSKRHQISDLANVRFVALPNPKLAPYGAAAVEALEHEGIWQKVQPKVVIAENVRQALEMFDSGNADAVITSDALLQGRDAQQIPSDWHKPILQTGAILTATKNLEAARQFLRFLTGPSGQAILGRYGMLPPPAAH